MIEILTRELRQGRSPFLFPLLLSILLFGTVLVPARANSSEWLYTVQAGSFPINDLTGAGRRFMLLSEKLGRKLGADLRIEQAEKRFLVRVGQFSSAAAAQNLLKKVSQSVPGAGLSRERIDKFWQNPVLIAYDEKSFMQSRKSLEASLMKAPKDHVGGQTTLSEQKQNTIPKSQEVGGADALLDEISQLYGSYNYENATELIRQGIRRWPHQPEFYGWNGATLLDTGRPDEALIQYRKAAELMPNVPEYHAGSGFSLLNIYVDRAKQSIEAFEKALSLDPDNINAIEGLGIVYASTGQRVQAEKLHKRLRQLDGDAAARLSEYIRWGIDWRR